MRYVLKNLCNSQQNIVILSKTSNRLFEQIFNILAMWCIINAEG